MASVLNFSIRDHDGLRVFDLNGSIDSRTSEVFAETLAGYLPYENVVLNLEDVKLITTGGLMKIVELSRVSRESGKRVIILNPAGDFVRIIETFDLYRFVVMADSIEEAVKKIKYYT